MPRTQHVHVSSPLPLSCPLREVTSSLLLIGLFFRTSAPPFASPSLPILPHLDARPHRWPARSFRDPMFSSLVLLPPPSSSSLLGGSPSHLVQVQVTGTGISGLSLYRLNSASVLVLVSCLLSRFADFNENQCVGPHRFMPSLSCGENWAYAEVPIRFHLFASPLILDNALS